MSRKPSPGVCGVCGRARVRPTYEHLLNAERAAYYFGRNWFTVNGHHYVEGKLVRVRCVNHDPQSWWGYA